MEQLYKSPDYVSSKIEVSLLKDEPKGYNCLWYAKVLIDLPEHYRVRWSNLRSRIPQDVDPNMWVVIETDGPIKEINKSWMIGSEFNKLPKNV